MLKITSIASGSGGNCVLVSSAKTNLLLDIGISTKKVREGLSIANVKPEELSGVLISHCHCDHISGAPRFLERYDVPVFCERTSLNAIKRASECVACVEIKGNDFFVGDITVSPFRLSHDVPCYGFSFYCAGEKVSIATDLGTIDERVIKNLLESSVVMLESNHDEQTLKDNPRYPYYLKRRILSDLGHLSNRVSAKVCASLAEGGVKKLILAHLSERNNSPKMALECLQREFIERGIGNVEVFIAEQSKVLVC